MVGSLPLGRWTAVALVLITTTGALVLAFAPLPDAVVAPAAHPARASISYVTVPLIGPVPVRIPAPATSVVPSIPALPTPGLP